MAGLGDVLRELRQQQSQAHLQIKKLEKAISVIENLTAPTVPAAANGTRPKRRMSAAGRKRIAEAQRARWAKLRKPPQSAAIASRAAGTPKRKLSPEGRKRIAAAAKARWARLRAQQKKKAA